MDARTRYGSNHGLSLLDTTIALALLATVTAGVAHLFGLSTRAVTRAREDTAAAVLAASKLEQLRSLTWQFELDGSATSDTSTDVTAAAPISGGVGLTPSPPDALRVSTPGYVDYLNGSGRWQGTGSQPRPGTVYIRRWAVTPLAADPLHTVILEVDVTTLADESRGQGGAASRVRLSTLRTRR
jgi:type II secretory pathway pseudopilin PulG